MPDVSCFICEKQASGDAAEGGVLDEDNLVDVGHMHTMRNPAVVHLAPRYPGTPREYWGPRIRD